MLRCTANVQNTSMNVSKYSSHFVDENSQFIVNLLVEFVQFVT